MFHGLWRNAVQSPAWHGVCKVRLSTSTSHSVAPPPRSPGPAPLPDNGYLIRILRPPHGCWTGRRWAKQRYSHSQLARHLPWAVSEGLYKYSFGCIAADKDSQSACVTWHRRRPAYVLPGFPLRMTASAAARVRAGGARPTDSAATVESDIGGFRPCGPSVGHERSPAALLRLPPLLRAHAKVNDSSQPLGI